MAQWGLGETPYLKARKSTGSDLEEALSPISTTITSTSNDTNATRSPRDRRRVPLTDLTTSTLSSRSSLFEPAHAVQPRTIQEVGYALNRPELTASGSRFFAAHECQWPTYVVPLDIFLDLAELEAHEGAFAQGVVREWDGQEKMLFISHQWLGFRRPDSDDHLQLRAVQGALRALRAGRVEDVFVTAQDAMRCLTSEEASSVEGDLSFSNQDLVERVRRSLATTLDRAAIWVDYASISQANDEDLARGVASLPYYIENSSLFLAVVPPALHADLRVCCDRRSYADRGWCRFELLIAELAATAPLKLLVHSATAVSVPEQGDYFIDEAQCDRSVFNGEFSCCRRTGGHRKGTTIPCDRDRIAAVLEPFYAARVAELHASGKPHLARLWTYLEARVFAGAPTEGHAGRMRLDHARPRRRVVRDPKYGTDATPDAIGGIPTYYWCAEGRQELLLDGLKRGVSVNYASAPGITLLMEAALAGDARMISLLIKRGADPNAATHKLGITAAHRAAQAGHARALRALADGGADLDAQRLRDGETPLHRAAGRGKTRAATELVKLGASVEKEDFRGRTPLDHALAYAHAATVAKLLALGAGPDPWRSPPPARIGARDAKHADRVNAAVAAESHLRWFYFAQDRWHASHFRDREERARVLEAFRAFLAVGFQCLRRDEAHKPLETLDALQYAEEIERAEHCDWATQLGKIDVDVEPAADGAYACTARFRQRTEPPPDSPESMTDWTLKVKLRVWDAAPFLGAPPKMTAQLVHLRQTRLKACTPPETPRTPGTIKTRKARFRFSWPSFLRRKPQNRDSVDTRFRPGEEAVSPKSPAQQMVRRASSGLSSLGTAARTSAGSFSKFRRAMSMRSAESPLSGGGDE